MASYVVTGAAKNYGLALVTQLSLDPANTVFALIRSRDTAAGLLELEKSNEHKNVHVLLADLRDNATIDAAAEGVKKATGGKLDVLILNGGALYESFDTTRPLEDDLKYFFNTNVVGNVHFISTFLPLIREGKAKKVIAITSTMGNHAYAIRNENGAFIPYAASKAALNMVIAKYAVLHKGEGIIFLAVHPGAMNTVPGPKEFVDKVVAGALAAIRKGNPNYKGGIELEDAAKQTLSLIKRITLEESGSIVHRNGEPVGDIEI